MSFYSDNAVHVDLSACFYPPLPRKGQKRLDLRRGVAAGAVVGVEREALVGPVGQDLHEAAAFQPGRQAEREALEHALPGLIADHRRVAS